MILKVIIFIYSLSLIEEMDKARKKKNLCDVIYWGVLMTTSMMMVIWVGVYCRRKENMKNKKEMMCPFRTVTETFRPLMAGQLEITRTNFEPCLEKNLSCISCET